ncbi:MAG: hypothetical protein E7583_00590, partial [Ruminococcaceae bacterium]|nr:hypothetical protein [Oscillospiraceae bacterium]
MKIKRLFAALLTALMVVSCFSFTANAQETQTVTGPVAYYTAKAQHGSFRVMGGLTKTRMYDAVEDVIFYHHTDIPGGNKHYDAYGLGTVPVTNGLIYFAADIRTNYSATPNLNVYGAKLTGSTSNSGGTFSAASATKADGNWERVVIKIENDKLESFNQNHIKLLGASQVADFTGDKYLDVAVFGYFNDEYSALNYDFGTVTAPKGAASFSVDGAVTTEVPTADPEVEDGFFMGWSADADATRGDAVTALSKVPDADTTYYAIFSGEIEDEKAVYISANGSDANSGRHSKAAVGSFAKANALLAGEGIDTLYVVGAFTLPDTITLGVAGKTINVYGYNGTIDSIAIGSKHVKFAGDVVIDNIILSRTSNDGGYQLLGNNVTIGDNVITSGNSNFISQGYYGSNITDADGSVLNVNSGTWQRIATTTFTDKSYTGNAIHNIGGTAVVDRVFGGHGNGGSNQIFNGTYTLNVDDSAKITTIDFTSTGGGTVAPINKHNGAILININGGTVENIKTTSSRDTDVNADVTVIEINAPGAVTGKIARNLVDGDARRVVIYNNGSFVDGQVEDATVFETSGSEFTVVDPGAIVLNVSGADVHADVTVAEDYTATINGFTYDLEFNYYNAVKIGTKEFDLADFENGIIPFSEFAAGVNTVEFFEADSAPITTVYVSDNGNDANKGDTAEAPLKTMKAVRALLDADNSAVETVYLVGTVTITADDATTTRPSISIGAAGRKIKYLGYTEDDVADFLDARLMPVYLIGEVEMDNFTFHQQTTYDGKLMAEGHNITIGEGMKFGGYDAAPTNFVLGSGTSTKLTNFYYNLKGNSSGSIPTPLVNTITINGSKIASVQPAIYSGDATFKGEVTVNVNNNTEITDVRLGGQGYSNTINTYGTIILNVNDNAKITNVVSEVGGNSIGNYSGLREININGGNVGTIKTTAKASSSKGTATKREQLMVVTVNGGTLGAITKPVDDENENSQIVVIFNDGVDAVEYTDAEAYVLDVTGGDVAADTTVSEDYTTATLNKFTYANVDTTYDQVTIKAGDVTNTYKLADLNGEIAPDKLTKGVVNEITFSKYVEAPKTADYTIKTYTMGTDGAYGEAVTETKTAEVGTTATIEPEAKTGFTISTGSTLSGTVTADGLLTLSVYYDRNQYKLYTKADAEAEAVEAGTYYYEAALTAPATPEKDGYTFKAWDPTVPATMPANDVTLTATWEKNAPTTATLKFYADAEAADAWVTKTVDIGATADVFPIWSDVGRETKGTNDIFAYPDNASYHFLGWSTDGTVEN